MNNSKSAQQSIQLIEPSKGWNFICFKELWKYRELFYFLALRDVKVRYKQTIFGLLWAIIQPLLSVFIFTFLFSRLVNAPIKEVSYPVFILSGWLPWMFFQNGINSSSNSLVSEANLIKKVYFPRLIMPIAKISAGFVEFFITLSLLLIIMCYNGCSFRIEIIFLPLAILYLFLLTAGIGIWLSAINALYRDVRHAVPFILQMWFFITPVIYPMNIVSPKWQVIYYSNPMNGVVELFRWILLGSEASSPFLLSTVSISLLMGCVLLVFGTLYFRRMEKLFADVV